jgi:Amt family ammonium transporter
LTVTQIAAAMGALTWIIIEGIHHRKATSLGLASGILAGLVAITPAAGDVLPYGALVLGAVAALACYGAILLKARLGYDDSLDVFGVHGIAGIVGAVGLAFLLRPDPFHHPFWTQLWYQVEGAGLSIVYAAIGTLILVVLVDKTLGMRMAKDDEMSGMDHSLHGETGYGLINPN